MRKTSLFVIFLTLFIDLLGFGIVIPLLAYYAKEYGASGKLVGMVVATYSFMQFLFTPLWGRLSDRIGRRPVLLVSLTGSVAGYFLFAFSRSLEMLFVARAVAGIAAANIGTAQAYISDITAPRDRAKGMGLIGAAFGLGFILGPPIGGLLATASIAHHHHGNLYPGLAAATLSLIAFTVAIFVLGESKTTSAPSAGRRFDFATWKSVGANRTLTALFVALLLVILSFAGMETSVTLHGRERFGFTARDLGYCFGFMGVIVALLQGTLLGKLSRRFGETNLIRFGAGSLAIGMIAAPAIYNPAALYPVALFIALGQGLCYPSITSLLSKMADPERVGSVLGMSSSVASAARIVGPLLAGLTYDAFGVQGPFYTGAVFVLAAILVVTVGNRRQ